MSRSSRIARHLIALSASVLILCMVGCSEQLPFTPQSGDDSYLATPNFVRVLNAPQGTVDNYRHWPRLHEVGRGMITREGGTVVGGRYMVIVPPRAIPVRQALFVIYEVSPGEVMCELQPNGMYFLRPVQLVIDLEGTSIDSPQSAQLYWYNDQAHGWVPMPGGPWSEDQTKFCGELKHFSRYALAN